MKKIKGFTLIELLITISIIGILAVVGLAIYPNAQKNTRDAQRKSDLRQYQNLLEIDANKNGGFYDSRMYVQQADTAICADLGQINCPKDPKNSDPYIYRYVTSDTSGNAARDATNYVLWVTLENPPSGSPGSVWVVCSNGKSGLVAAGLGNYGSCPL